MAVKTGILSKAYYRSSGNYGSPTHSELTIINDLTVDDSWDVLDAPSRATVANTKALGGKTVMASGTVKNDGSALWTALLNASVGGYALDMHFLDGDITTNNSTGYRADCYVTKFTEDQSRGARLYNQVEFVLAESDNLLKRVLVTSNVATYANVGTGAAPSYA